MADMYMEYARLLTSENVTLTYSDEVDTAYFDVENRSIVLPLMDYLDRDCNAGLTAHECGHALFSKYSPDDIKNIMDKYGDIFNVVEDGYVEKMIVSKYPGILNFFKKAYQRFYDNDFFGVNKNELDKLDFLDKLNMNLKLNRIGINIPMGNSEENVLLHKAYIVTSNEEVLKLCDDIYDYLKRNNMVPSSSSVSIVCNDGDEAENGGRCNFPKRGMSRNSANSSYGNESMKSEAEAEESRESGNSNGYEDGINTTSKTMQSFNEALKKEIEEGKTKVKKTREGEKMYPIIIKDGNIRNDLMDDISMYLQKLDIYFETNDDPQLNSMVATVKKLARNAVVYFEKLKQAKAIKAEKNKSTGKIDHRKLAQYKTSSNIFIKRRIQPRQKNHGVVLLIDFSSSMWSNVIGVLLQTAIVTEFCKMCSIPFSIITFGASYTNRDKEKYIEKLASQEEDDMLPFVLRQMYNKTIIKIADERHYSLKGLLSFHPAFFGSYNFTSKFNKLFFKDFSIHMGQTPTDNGVLCAYEEMKEMKNMYGLDKMNLILITDGDHNNNYPYCNILSDYYHEKKIPAGMSKLKVIDNGRIWFDYGNVTFNNYKIERNDIFKYPQETASYGEYENYLESLFYAMKRDMNAKIVFSFIDSMPLEYVFGTYDSFQKTKERDKKLGFLRSIHVSTYLSRLFDDYYYCHGSIPKVDNTVKVCELKDLSVIDKVILSCIEPMHRLNFATEEEMVGNAQTMAKLKSAIKKNSQTLDYLDVYVRDLIEEIA